MKPIFQNCSVAWKNILQPKSRYRLKIFAIEKTQIGSNFGSGITLEYFLPRIDSECKNIAQRAILNFALVHTLEILPKVLRYPRRRFTTIKCIIDEDFPKQFSTRTTRQRRKNRVKGLSDKSKLRLVFKSMLRWVGFSDWSIKK